MTRVDDDRARILLRRAAFLSGTLAAIGGCTRQEPAEAPGTTSLVAVAEPEQGESDSPPPRDREDQTRDREMPSLEMPSGIGAKARERFQRLFGTAQKQHALLDDLEGLVPDGCRVLDPQCEERWRKLAAKHNELRMAQTFMHGCPGSSADAKLYAEREREHFDYLAARQKKIFDRVQQTLDKDGKAGEDRWARMQEEAYGASPYPCLSIACEDW